MWNCACSKSRSIEVPECFKCSDTITSSLGEIINNEEGWLCPSDSCLKSFKFTEEETSPVKVLGSEILTCPDCNIQKLDASLVALKKLAMCYSVLLADSTKATPEELRMACRFAYANLNSKTITAYGGAMYYGIPVENAHPLTAGGLGLWLKRIAAVLTKHRILFDLTPPGKEEFRIYTPTNLRFFGPTRMTTRKEFNYPANSQSVLTAGTSIFSSLMTTLMMGKFANSGENEYLFFCYSVEKSLYEGSKDFKNDVLRDVTILRKNGNGAGNIVEKITDQRSGVPFELAMEVYKKLHSTANYISRYSRGHPNKKYLRTGTYTIPIPPEDAPAAIKKKQTQSVARKTNQPPTPTTVVVPAQPQSDGRKRIDSVRRFTQVTQITTI